MDEERIESIAGRVDAVIYSNEENGYTVLRLRTQDGDRVTVTGCLPMAAPGEEMTLSGRWQQHPAHGEQFQAEYAERTLPTGTSAIYEYLACGAIKGVGPATATLLVQAFGERTLDVIEREPEKLVAVRGISRQKARDISESFKKKAGVRRLMEFLGSHNLRPLLAMRLYAAYGDRALDTVCGNPYVMTTGNIGGSFPEADALALDLGFDGDCAARVSAAILFELRHNTRNGHCFIPWEKLAAATTNLINVEPSVVEEQLDVLTETGEVVLDTVCGLRACYLPRLHESECEAAEHLRAMAQTRFHDRVNTDAIIAEMEKAQGIRYAPTQRQVIELAAGRQVLVLTGGPGTGKTTCIRAVLALYEALGLETQLAAPTGRAAKRMSELTGQDAVTVHRLLEARFAEHESEVCFGRTAGDPLTCDALILDECSMVDISLFAALLDALPPECRLFLVGDADQLPSVGPGNVFSDIIRSGVVPVVRLTEIFRQGSGSRIVTSAHAINAGEHPNLRENTGDLFFLRRREPEQLAETIVGLCSERLPKKMGIDPREIQVLTPTRQRETGTAALNRCLQAALNPPSPEKKEKKVGETAFREGDRVMQIRNDYDIIWKNGPRSGQGVYNGDIGYITQIDPTAETVTVDFDGRCADYAFSMLDELEHAWAMTVHKSQGSEYRAVILAVGSGPQRLLHRGLLYTAVTRARELLVLVGDEQIVSAMIDNYRQTRRYSGLRVRLAEGATA